MGYFDKCFEINLVPILKKFKPPNLEVYKHQDYYLRIEEENPILNTQITLNGKRTVLSIH